MRAIPLILVAAAVAGCGTTNTSLTPSSGTILPNTKFVVSPSISFTFEEFAVAAAAAGVLYTIYDPLAPNWQIDEQVVDDDSYFLSLRAKSFRIGGDGEAVQIFKRRAAQLQRARGYAGYRIIDYSESIESGTPLTHRTSEGTIQLVRAQAGR